MQHGVCFNGHGAAPGKPLTTFSQSPAERSTEHATTITKQENRIPANYKATLKTKTKLKRRLLK